MAIIGYARVSTLDQDYNLQTEVLRKSGCEKIFSEKKSGTSTKNRSELKLCLDYIRQGDILIVTRVDRLVQPDHFHLFIKHDDTKLINHLRHEQDILVKDNWKNVYDLADPAMHGIIDLLEKYQTPIPDVAIDIFDENGGQITELELAWPHKKIAIAVDKNNAILATKQGWKVWSMRNSLTQIDALTASLR